MTNAMPTVDDFNAILKKHGLKPCYNLDAAETERQLKLPSVKPILTAFDEGVAALFVMSERNQNLDNLMSGPRDNPSSWNLSDNPSDDEVKKAVIDGLNKDSNISITLLPEVFDPEGNLFPPEYNEDVKDFWIWYIDTPGYFPGPLWILVKRDGTEPAFHYGYM